MMEPEPSDIAIVLSRASKLHSKLSTCIIERASSAQEEEEDDYEDTETLSLINIRDALESLEQQLSSLQTLQQRQCLEREANLKELDASRRILINKLKEYRGTELEVIQETCVFAGGSVEQRDSIVLPPYGGHLPGSFFSSVDESRSLPTAHSVRRRNPSNLKSSVTGDEREESDHENDCDERGESSSPVISKRSAKKLASGMDHIIGLTTKAVFVVASVISIFTLVCFEPKIRRNASLKISGLLSKRQIQIPPVQLKADVPRCPPGKILLIEDGFPRCFVKERVEVPFEPVIEVPDVSYGCG